MNPPKERNHSLDALKFVCAFLVVIIHVRSYYREFAKPLDKCAVPIFFMISGYLLYTNLGRDKILKSIKRISKLFLSVLALYAVLFPLLLKCGLTRELKLLDIPVFIFTNEVPFAYHLWYLPAYLYVLGLVLFVEKYNKLNILFPLSVAIILFYLIGSYSLMAVSSFSPPECLTRNFLFEGIPFFSIGMFLNQNETKLKKTTDTKLYIIIIFALLVSIVEWRITSSQGMKIPYYLGTVVLSVAILVLCLKHYTSSQNIIAKLGRNYSLSLYLLHPIVRYPFTYYEKYASETAKSLYYCFSPFIVTCLTILLIILLKKIRLIKT